MTRRLPALSLFLVSLWVTACGCSSPPSMVVVTFDVGTTTGLAHEGPPEDGYGNQQARIGDAYYGNSLAWPPAIAAARRFFEGLRPDLVPGEAVYFDHCPVVCSLEVDG